MNNGFRKTGARNKQIDALRALALLLVLGHHFGNKVYGVSTWIPLWTQMGWSGVDLFFVLSGFLISGILFREYKSNGTLRIGRFLMRRSLKIYPAYYVVLIGSALTVDVPSKWTRIAVDCFFIQNYALGVWGHLWSMAVEEHFYILLPFSFWVVMKFKPDNPFGNLPAITGVVMVLCLTLRSIPFWLRQPYAFPAQSQLRFDGLALGVLLSYLWEFRPNVINWMVGNNGWWLLGSSAMLLSPQFVLPLEHPFMYTIGLTSTYLGYGGLLIYSMRCLNGENPFISRLAKIGVHSYTIYLLHLPILALCITAGFSANWFRLNFVFTAYVGLSIVLGLFFSQLVELPILRLRQIFFPPSSAADVLCERPTFARGAILEDLTCVSS